MKKSNAYKPRIVLFVEGETDEVFFNALIAYYRMQSKSPIASCMVVNLKGVARYISKVAGKLENGICPKAQKEGYEIKAVFCSYDTDVFETCGKLIFDWSRLKREVLFLGIKEFHRIEVRHEIEDWLLDDVNGICSYLHIAKVPSLSGKTGYDKIVSLFNKGNDVYLKGKSVKKFIGFIDMNTIRAKHSKELKMLEELLGVKW